VVKEQMNTYTSSDRRGQFSSILESFSTLVLLSLYSVSL